MDNKLRKKCADHVFDLYPRCRKLMYRAFDELDPSLTRTQQIILLSLSVRDNLSMSKLADSINTSNEQATRAVTQLVNMSFVDRTQNKNNRRVVNITLTDKARAYIESAKKHMLTVTAETADILTDEQIKQICDTLELLSKLLGNDQ